MMGGTKITDENRAAAIAEHGADHIATCPTCDEEYLWVTKKAETCWSCWYGDVMDRHRETYRDVFDALHRAEIPAEITQTGGMCMAIWMPWPKIPGGHFLLTDREDSLSSDREDSDGWCIGLYDDECSDPLWSSEAEHKTADEAVRLAMEGVRAAQKL